MFQGISSTNVFFIILTVKIIIQAMDKNGDGSVSFDEWLSFSQAEIISKVFKIITYFHDHDHDHSDHHVSKFTAE